MKKIKEYVDMICEELEGAKCYAEKSVYYKAKGDSNLYGKFRSMAEDELNHSMTIHEIAVGEIEMLNTVFKAPKEMQDEWDRVHVEYVEKSAWIRQMLSM